eukprot:Awhi_evm1s9024
MVSSIESKDPAKVIQSVFFGEKDNSHCEPWEITPQFLELQLTDKFPSENSSFAELIGDPCPGIDKKIYIEY